MAIKKEKISLEPEIKEFKTKKVPNAFVISQYYGFNAIDLPEILKEDRKNSEKIKKGQKFEHQDLPETEEAIALVRSYKNKNFRESEDEPEGHDPVMLYSEGKAKGSKIKPKKGEKVLNLHIIGTPKSIAEAILIKTALSILSEEGYKNISVEINNLGGKEAAPIFFRELTNYYKKHINEMDYECRQLLKDGPFALVTCGKTLKSEIKAQAPSPFNFLSDANKNHLKEVIEFLDEENIPYDINKDILGNPHYSTSTVFTIIDKKSGKILATGSRYNHLAKKIDSKKNIPGIGITIRLPKLKIVPLSKIPKSSKIKFFFIQLGFPAKIKSLKIIDELRNAKIFVHQSISKDKLTTQLAKAKKMRADYVIIIGQKEAHDGTVVIRDMRIHSQVSVPQEKLVEYLKGLK
jgi:histidyl-tRNA synthetase